MLRKISSKHFDRWLPGYGRHLARTAFAPKHRGTKHLLFAVCDHYEPLWQRPSADVATARVQTWVDRYPRLAERFRDTDGRPPQHTFFFPGEEYRPEFFEGLETLIKAGFGEMELHLHHDRATEASMRAELESYLSTFTLRGHFTRAPDGSARYAFIHGNWALANARPDGRLCGVDAELPLLFETGCYADFTFPSVPDVSQPNIVNQIYWPMGDLRRRRAYERGEPARVGRSYDDRLLMITGPVTFTRRKGTIKPRLEYGALTAADPPSLARVSAWVRQGIHVAGRPDWIFVKVYTHGAPEAQAAALLGEDGRELHRVLNETYNDGESWQLHYVTAREMYNIAKAAMAGESGNPNAFRDYELPPPPIVAEARPAAQDQDAVQDEQAPPSSGPRSSKRAPLYEVGTAGAAGASAAAAASRRSGAVTPLERLSIVYHHRTQGTGAEGVHIAHIVGELRNLGHEVQVASPNNVEPGETAGNNPFSNKRSLRRRALSVISSSSPQLVFEGLELSYNAFARRKLLQAAQNVHGQAYLYERHAFFMAAGAQLAAELGLPYIVEVNEIAGEKRVREQVLVGLAKRIEGYVFREADAIIVVSRFLKDKIAELGVPADKIHVVPNGVDERVFDPERTDADVRSELGIGEHAVVVGFVGWFVAWHNLELLLKAFAAVAKGRDAVLMLVGDGVLKADLEAMAQHLGIGAQVVFPGAVPYQGIPRHINAMDICVIPGSNAYRSPIKMFEYMAMGKVVVAPSHEPITSVIRDGDNGALFAPDDQKQLCERLRALFADAELRRRIGAQARRDVLARHLWRHNAERVVALFQEAAAQRNARWRRSG